MLETSENSVTYVIGSSGKFEYPYRFYRTGDLKVYLDDMVLVEGSDYTVEKRERGDGVVTLVSGSERVREFPIGRKLTIRREIELKQETSLPEYGKLSSKALETQLDKIVMMIQQLKEITNRCVVWNFEEIDREELIRRIEEAGGYAESALASSEAARRYREGTAGDAEICGSAAAAAADAIIVAAGILSAIRAIEETAQVNEVHLNFGRRVGEESSCIFGRRV